MISRLKKGERGFIVSKNIPSGCPSCKKAFTKEQNSNKIFYSRIQQRLKNAKIYSTSNTNSRTEKGS